MIYKVYYQETKKTATQKREQTHSLYIDAESAVAARRTVEQNTPYNIEFIQELDEKHLAYEKENADFKLAEF